MYRYISCTVIYGDTAIDIYHNKFVTFSCLWIEPVILHDYLVKMVAKIKRFYWKFTQFMSGTVRNKQEWLLNSCSQEPKNEKVSILNKFLPYGRTV